MKKDLITEAGFGPGKMKNRNLTIGLDLGDRSTFYCVLDESGDVILERQVRTTAKALAEAFAVMPKSRIALETGTHSPLVSRLFSEHGVVCELNVARRRRCRGEK